MYLIGEKELALEMTRLSERGQIVIPTELRKSMHLKEGERFVIMGIDDTIILRKLEFSKERMRLKRLISESRKKASKSGFSGREIQRLIEKTREER